MRGTRLVRGKRWSIALLTCASSLLVACELTESTIVDVEDVVVAEVYVELGQGYFVENRVIAFLHRTVGGLGPGFSDVPGAHVSLRRTDGSSFEFAEAPILTCTATLPVEGTGSCYWLAPTLSAQLVPGEALELTITLPDGGVLRSATLVPGDFNVIGIEEGAQCVLPSETSMNVMWSVSKGAWAYINETSIRGLQAGLAPQGIEMDSDTLNLLGLSVSAADTTIMFPGEFGVFNRFELDQALANSLQKGLPAGTRAVVTVSAADRNYVNWVRGGNFNPSGQVRVPSMIGDGTGVFASVVTRSFEVVVNPHPLGGEYSVLACPAG